ncbi:MAG: hypothetical protein SCH71_05260 [Desulfobulbaceae bacterium]|nr:hypothetical protein [Desulfobulbaceae bacterium]
MSGASIPQKLKVRIGGILGSWYSVRIKGSDLLYRIHKDEDEDDFKELKINPGEQQWRDFRKALDDIGIWQWKEEYPNPGEADSTQWFVELEWDGRTIKSSGDSNFPIADGNPENEAEMSPTFDRFLDAVRKLIGDLEFR